MTFTKISLLESIYNQNEPCTTKSHLNESQTINASRTWLRDLVEYKFRTEHKKEADSVLALSRLNLSECNDEKTTYAEKIIYFVGLRFESGMEIIEFHNIIVNDQEEKGKSAEESDPIEFNSQEFFVKALSYIECKVRGKLSSKEQSPNSPVRSDYSTIDIQT